MDKRSTIGTTEIVYNFVILIAINVTQLMLVPFASISLLIFTQTYRQIAL